jgi:UDP-glucuronate decarboxylase
MKRILVTGSGGFLGSHLADRLLAAGHHVIGLDNFSSGARANIAHLQNHPRFELLEQDVAAPLDISPDMIFNLACPASPNRYQSDPVLTVRTNVLGAINMLELARASKAVILQASTSEVYGDPEISPQPESYCGRVNPIGPRACYDEGKRCAETLFFDYHRQYQLPIKVVRIFNTYGPRMQADDGRVVSNFVVQALKGEDLTVYGDGSQTRSFCYVDDLIEGLVRVAATPEAFTGPINLGNPVQSTMLSLAHTVIRLVGSRSKISFKSLPADDPKQRQPDIALATHLIGWQPAVKLEEGLTATIDYFRRTL